MSIYDNLVNIAKKNDCEVLFDEPLSKHTTFKIGGNADVFINVNNEGALKELNKTLDKEKIPFFVIGKGSNLLVSDEGLRGVILYLTGEFDKIKLLDDNTIECGCAVTLSRFCMFALKNSLSGLEFAWGIPGSAGGAAFMNAGAYGGEMKDVIISCKHIDKSGNTGSLSGDKLNFSYRSSAYKDSGCIITSVKVKLKRENPILIRKRMDEYMSRRKEKQPIEYPSAGSVFKRPPDNFAGTLIEKCGLKGKRIGNAMVSQKHAGFIINMGGATCKDVLDLISLIKNTVLEETGVELECEIKSLECKQF